MKIFILGYHGHGNAGDDAMTRGMFGYLYPHKTLINLPDDTAIGIIRKVRFADIVVIPGGTHLRNWGKGWFWQSSRMLLFGCLCRLLGKKFYMCNVGIDGKGWEWLARKIANKVTIRDRETFDTAALMDYDLTGVERKKIIGVNLTPANAIYYNKKSRDILIAVSIWSAVKSWLDIHPDWSAKLISFNSNGKYSDNPLNEAVSKSLRATFVPYSGNPLDTLCEVAECSVMIGMRYHACVFAALARVPLLGIESYPSVHKFMWKQYPLRAISYERVIDMPEFSKIFNRFMQFPDQKQVPFLTREQMIELARKGIEL